MSSTSLCLTLLCERQNHLTDRYKWPCFVIQASGKSPKSSSIQEFKCLPQTHLNVVSLEFCYDDKAYPPVPTTETYLPIARVQRRNPETYPPFPRTQRLIPPPPFPEHRLTPPPFPSKVIQRFTIPFPHRQRLTLPFPEHRETYPPIPRTQRDLSSHSQNTETYPPVPTARRRDPAAHV